MWDINSLSIFDDKNLYTDTSKIEFATLSLQSFNPLILNEDGYGYCGGKNGDILIDKKHKYTINKYGYRGDNFINKAEVLFAGCSQTFGIGIPEEMIWGNQLGKFLHKNVANISRPGGSVQWIVQKIFAYCGEFGNPSYIVCLFPDFFRILSPQTDINKYDSNMLKTLNLENHINSRQPYSKRPHNLEDVLELDFALYLSIQYIHILEQYCKSHNINLYWSSWDEKTTEIIQRLKDKYNIFMYYKSNAKYEELSNCHTKIYEQYSHCFHNGTDIEANTSTHFGVHFHTHIAENFLKIIESKK